jgi:hypothetical protein
LNLSELSSNFRLHNFVRKSGASEDEIESFIIRVSTGDISPENIVSCVNQLYEISKAESIPLDQVSGYINKKLEEKQKIDEQIKEADATLQSKNATIEAINEYLKLKEELDKYGISAQDINKLLNLLSNAKENGFDSKKIVTKLRSIRWLEKRQVRLKNNCEVYSRQLQEYKDIIPLTEDIAALQIKLDELIAVKAAINQAVKLYNLPPLAAILRLVDDIKKYNKIDGLKKELSALSLQKFAINETCSRQSQALITLAKLQSRGVTENQLISLNNFLEINQSSL